MEGRDRKLENVLGKQITAGYVVMVIAERPKLEYYLFSGQRLKRIVVPIIDS